MSGLTCHSQNSVPLEVHVDLSAGIVARTDNPVCRVSMERENNKRDRWLTVDEETRLLNAAAPWLRELMLFAIHSGMRMGEILDLTWAGVSVLR